VHNDLKHKISGSLSEQNGCLMILTLEELLRNPSSISLPMLVGDSFHCNILSLSLVADKTATNMQLP
jgi:hypothetical protein